MNVKEKDTGKGMLRLIECDKGNDIFVWKSPIEDFNYGSQLVVHESQEAIFFKDGKAMDTFGPGRYTLSTQNLPIIGGAIKIPFGGESIFRAEVYFVNMTTQMGIRWGTDTKVRLFDPASGLYVEIGACGSFNIKVSDPRRLVVKLVGTEGMFTQAEIFANGVGDGDPANANGRGKVGMIGKFKTMIISTVKSNLARAIKEANINILEIDAYLDQLSAMLRPIINDALAEYGLTIPEFYISSILTPDDDPNYRRLKEQFAAKTLNVREEEIKKATAEAARERKLVEAQTDAQLKIIEAQASAEAYKTKAYAEAEEMRVKGYTYQQETAREVGLEAMKNGISGGSGGGIGEVASLGVALGAMGSVAGMTRDALNPVADSTAAALNPNAPAAPADTWDCTCGEKAITRKFCPECGAKRPEKKAADSWDCACGEKGITRNFCPECGAKRPAAPTTWDCACGEKGITRNFCPECGAKRPEAPTTWDCACGEKGITAKFCPECGTKRPEITEEENSNE